MIMMATSDSGSPGPAAGPGPEDDVVVLAGDRLVPDGMWVLVTRVEAEPGGVFTGVRLSAADPRASGGDVLLRLAAGPGRLPGLAAGHVQVAAVMAGKVVLVGEWGLADSADWSEVVRVTAAFTMGALAELEERGADLRSGEGVDLETAAPAVAAGVPPLAGTTVALLP
jgi:hypothetical protein